MPVPRLPLLIALLAAAAGCQYNPATGRRQLLLLSVEQAIALGAEAKPALVQDYGGEVTSPELRSYVDNVGHTMARLTEADYPNMPWEFTVLDSDVVNAFALPDGSIFASRGLLARLDNEAQMAGVLGHEIGHVTAQHVNERISQSMFMAGIAAGAAAATSDADSDWVRYGVPLMVGVGGQGYLLSFNRNQESEADEQGVKYMTAAGYNPHAMLEVLDVLEATAQGPRPPEFLSTHPHPETRKETVSELLAGPYGHTQNNEQFKKYRDRYHRDALPHLETVQAAAGGAGLPVRWCAVCRASSPGP